MGKVDIECKEYMSNTAYFADVVNYYVFDGSQVVVPDALTPLDTAEIVIPYGNGARMPEQKFRDVVKIWNAMMDDEAVYVVYGVENQSEVHYAMPVRTALYDFMNYARQVSEAARSYRNREAKGDAASNGDMVFPKDRVYEEGNLPVKLTNGEYLSGFRKEDKLIPVITLVLYFGSSEWDGPMTIRQMLSTKHQDILYLAQDYRINLIAPAQIPDDDFDKFRTDLGSVLQYIKYSNDKDRLEEIVHSLDRFRLMNPDSGNLVNVVTGSELKITVNEEGKFDMCKAIDEMRKESRDEGKIEGRIETLIVLVRKGLLSLYDAAKEAGLTPDEFCLKMKGFT